MGHRQAADPAVPARQHGAAAEPPPTTDVDLSGCQGLTDAAVGSLAALFPGMTALSLQVTPPPLSPTSCPAVHLRTCDRQAATQRNPAACPLLCDVIVLSRTGTAKYHCLINGFYKTVWCVWTWKLKGWETRRKKGKESEKK